MNAQQPFDQDTAQRRENLTDSHRLWGVLLVVLGIAAMAMPLASGLAVAVTLGFILTIAGSVQLAFALQAQRFRKKLTRFMFGGITLAAGIFCITQSGGAAAALGLLLAVYFLIDGAFLLISAAQAEHHRGWLATYGAISLLLGLLLWIGWPLSGIVGIGVLLGIRLIFAGVMVVLIGPERAAQSTAA